MKNYKFRSPIQKFIKTESKSGILLFSSAILALIIANLPLNDFYNNILSYKIGITTEHFELVKPIILWINDGLMTIFFLLIGLEIKREILLGELNTIKKASLPIFAAIGGMLVPMLLFMLINKNPETAHGWGISMATDIAFTLAILQLLGKRVPLGLKIFLTAFAIIDDLGAVLVIAIFYTNDINWMLLLYGGLGLSILYILSYFKIHSKYLLAVLGLIIWVLFLKSGIHPTIAGIMLAFAVPVKQNIDEFVFKDKLCDISERLTESTNTNKLPVLSKEQIEMMDSLETLTDKVQSPLQQLEHRLHKWVAFLIMPVFAFANAGVQIGGGMGLDMPLVFTIIISLVLGKTLGVFLFSYASIKLKVASLPKNINFKMIFGAAILSGVGFTMSLFISNLAFFDNATYLNSAKIGIIAASLLAGLIGFVVLKIGLKEKVNSQ